MLHEEQPQETRSGMPHVENKNRRMYCSTSSITAAEEIREGRRANVEAYNPPTFVPMAPGHSITARSLSKQIRDELKINATDDHKVQGGHTSPERPSSPVFAPGHLRSSIQFFESLREK
ncbi:AAEL015610-PA [Aedes aegypti]|nr:AAEL015610-PA [Aedes aegypti]